MFGLDIFQMNPRLRVLANHAASDPCAFTLFEYAQVARHAPPLAANFTVMDLVRLTLDRYLAGMLAYGMPGYVMETGPNYFLMDRLLAKMREVGYDRFDLGLPGNLIPVRRADYVHLDPRWGGSKQEDGSDGFQIISPGAGTTLAGAVRHRDSMPQQFRPRGPTQYDNDKKDFSVSWPCPPSSCPYCANPCPYC